MTDVVTRKDRPGRGAADDEVMRQLEPHRTELTGYCYRMLGSSFEAEDAVQETLVRAWRGFDRFEGRAALRSWLYRIATNVCLDTLKGKERRARPMDLGPSAEPIESNLHIPGEITWLEPIPMRLIAPDRDPADVAVASESIRLAFVAALQRLPARQRAVLILREVLDWQASEVAELLDSSVASINSALQRARAALNAQMPPDPERAPLPRSAREREVVGAFADAIQNDDVDSVVSLLTDDALISKPPQTIKWQGREACRALALDERRHRPGKLWLVPTRANGQPAFGYYVQDVHTPIAHCRGLLVLTLRGSQISAVTLFDTTTLAWFGLPRTLEV